jgi:hypothetical protein
MISDVQKYGACLFITMMMCGAYAHYKNNEVKVPTIGKPTPSLWTQADHDGFMSSCSIRTLSRARCECMYGGMVNSIPYDEAERLGTGNASPAAAAKANEIIEACYNVGR